MSAKSTKYCQDGQLLGWSLSVGCTNTALSEIHVNRPTRDVVAMMDLHLTPGLVETAGGSEPH